MYACVCVCVCVCARACVWCVCVYTSVLISYHRTVQICQMYLPSQFTKASLNRNLCFPSWTSSRDNNLFIFFSVCQSLRIKPVFFSFSFSFSLIFLTHTLSFPFFSLILSSYLYMWLCGGLYSCIFLLCLLTVFKTRYTPIFSKRVSSTKKTAGKHSSCSLFLSVHSRTSKIYLSI